MTPAKSPIPWFIACVPLLAGCVISPDQYPEPGDLPQVWMVDRLRVLAVRADPPEVEPGDTVNFEALVVDPDEGGSLTIWLACPPEDEGGIGFGCDIDFDFDVDFENPDLDALEDAGLIGFEPLIPPVYNVAEDLLDGLTEEEALEGLNVLVQITVFPGGLDALDPASSDLDEIDFNVVESAYKRLIVSRAPTPNHNPSVTGFTMDGVEIGPDTTIRVEPFQDYQLGVIVPDTSIEPYDFVNRDGATESRVEEPYASWFTTGGTMIEPYTLHPFWGATWYSPQACAGEEDDPEDCLEAGRTHHGHFYAVVRDRRGGMDWVERRWEMAL